MGVVHRRIILISLFCWLPLFAISAWQGTLFDAGAAVSFFRDVEVHVRFLVVVPLLIGAELVVHRRMRSLVAQFLERDLIAKPDMPRFREAVTSAMRLRNSVWAEILLIALVYGVGILLIWRNFAVLDTESWYSTHAADGWRPTPAGLWYGFISVPVFQFLLLRWYFRIFVWARFLWQVSRIDLRLVPTHPDRAGGLGFLSGSVYAFVPLLMAHGAMLAGLIASRIFHLGETLTDFKLEIAAMVAFLICLVEGPLLVFAQQLERAKRDGKREYGRLAQSYARDFDAKWLRGGASGDAALLGSADVQSLADMASSYDVVQSMRITLVSKSSILTFAAAIVAPILPLALTMMPLEDLLKKLLGILF